LSLFHCSYLPLLTGKGEVENVLSNNLAAAKKLRSYGRRKKKVVSAKIKLRAVIIINRYNGFVLDGLSTSVSIIIPQTTRKHFCRSHTGIKKSSDPAFAAV